MIWKLKDYTTREHDIGINFGSDENHLPDS
jgi:hypothetical protein